MGGKTFKNVSIWWLLQSLAHAISSSLLWLFPNNEGIQRHGIPDSWATKQPLWSIINSISPGRFVIFLVTSPGNHLIRGEAWVACLQNIGNLIVFFPSQKVEIITQFADWCVYKLRRLRNVSNCKTNGRHTKQHRLEETLSSFWILHEFP